MTEVAPNVRTVDDVFQVLISRGAPPLKVKQRILEALRFGDLRIDLHVAAGARKTRPICQATPEELQDEQEGKSLDFLYERSPPGGITAPVDPQSWDGMLAVVIRNGHLIVESRCALDFPWQAYSFIVCKPVAIDELCPAPPLLTSSPPSIADRWVWQINPSLRGKDGYEPRNVQKECERLELEGKLSPAIQQKSVEAIVEELRRAGVKTSPSTVRRAFGSSKDRYRS